MKQLQSWPVKAHIDKATPAICILVDTGREASKDTLESASANAFIKGARLWDLLFVLVAFHGLSQLHTA